MSARTPAPLPMPMLEVPTSGIDRPFRPVIDAHNHLGAFGGGWDRREPRALLDRLDQAGVLHYVDLDGGWGEDVLDDRLRRFKALMPDRYRVFGGVAWSRWAEEGAAFPDRAAARLRAQATRGAEGLKVWKDFGLHVTDDAGRLAQVDDPRLDPVWATAGELKMPVMIHVADPVAFFQPLTRENERWDELHAHPDWHFPSPPFPPFRAILDAFARLVRRHPCTTFIGAHVGCYAENLAWVSALLDECPNLLVDPSARLAELGRQPYSARRFFLRHAGRILFGTDAGPDLATYGLWARFLESEDQHFAYSPSGIPSQGNWRVHGLHLPRDVLDAVYHDNAARLFGLLEAATTPMGHHREDTP